MRHIELLCLLPLLTVIGCSSTPEQIDQSEHLAPPAVPTIDPTYFALGALYEYAGYQADLFGDAIDTFAATRGPEAVVFAQYLERVAKERKLDTSIVVRDGDGGCTVVASQTMKDLLISLYPSPPVEPKTSPGRLPLPRHTRRVLQSSQELFKDRQSKRSYLAGVYLRFKAGSDLKFADSPHKVRLVRDLLIEMGCTDVGVTGTPRGHYPVMCTVSYVAPPEIEALFEMVDHERAAARGRR